MFLVMLFLFEKVIFYWSCVLRFRKWYNTWLEKLVFRYMICIPVW